MLTSHLSTTALKNNTKHVITSGSTYSGSKHDETLAPQPQPNKMFLLCLFLRIKVVKGKIQSIYIKGVLLTLINWINITNNIPNMVKNTR